MVRDMSVVEDLKNSEKYSENRESETESKESERLSVMLVIQ